MLHKLSWILIVTTFNDTLAINKTLNTKFTPSSVSGITYLLVLGQDAELMVCLLVTIPTVPLVLTELK